MAKHTVSYGPSSDQVGDLRLPPHAGPHPVIVILHGGFWKDQYRRDLMDGLAKDLTRSGYATWNLEYRRVSTGGGWPQTSKDVGTGVEKLADLADLDLAHVTIVGHSAGGHLALWVAGEELEVTLLRVVGLAAVSDLATAARLELGGGAVRAFLGGESPELYEAASPVERLPVGVPQLILHGDRDPDVPVEMSRSYIAAATEAGDEITYVELADTGHMELIDPLSDAWRAVKKWLATGSER